MDNISKLIEIFKDFPGIGPRQAKRFVYYLLNKNSAYSSDLANLIKEVRNSVHTCEECFRFFPNSNSKVCQICGDKTRDNTQLMIVPNDVDFENIEKTKSYNGYYFVLGGTVPILDKNPDRKIRQKELFEILNKKVQNKLTEIIIAVNYNPEGENTLSYLKEILHPILERNNIKVSNLGRGLSTGTELEYSDSETLKNALKNRQ